MTHQGPYEPNDIFHPFERRHNTVLLNFQIHLNTIFTSVQPSDRLPFQKSLEPIMPEKLFKPLSGGALQFEEGLCSVMLPVEQCGAESSDKYDSFNTVAL